MSGIPSYVTIQRDPNAAVHAVAGKHGSVDLDKGTQATIIDRVYKYMEQDSVKRQLTQHFGIGSHSNLRVRVQGSDVFVISNSGKSLKLTDKISQEILAPVHAARKEKEATFRASSAPSFAASTHGAFTHPGSMQMQQPSYGGAPMAPPPGHPGGFIPQQMQMGYPMMGGFPMMPMMGGFPMMPMMGGFPMMPMMGGFPMMYPPQGMNPLMPPQPTPKDGGAVADIHGMHMHGRAPQHDPAFLKLLDREQEAHEAAKRARAEAEEMLAKSAAQHHVDNTQKLLLLKGNLEREQKELEAEIATYEVDAKTYAPGWFNFNRILGRNRAYYDEVIIPQLEIRKEALATVNAEIAKIEDLIRLPKEPRLQKEKLLQLEAQNRKLQAELAAAREVEKTHPGHMFHGGHRVARHRAAPRHMGGHFEAPPVHGTMFERAETPGRMDRAPPMFDTHPHAHVRFKEPITHPFPAPRRPMAPPKDEELGFFPPARRGAAPKVGLYSREELRIATEEQLHQTIEKAQAFLESGPVSAEGADQAQADIANAKAELRRRADEKRHAHAPRFIRPRGFESGPAKEAADYTEDAIRRNLPVTSWDQRHINKSVIYLKKLANDTRLDAASRRNYQQWHEALFKEQSDRHIGTSYRPAHRSVPRTVTIRGETHIATPPLLSAAPPRVLHKAPELRREPTALTKPVRPEFAFNKKFEAMNEDELIIMWNYYNALAPYYESLGRDIPESERSVWDDQKAHIGNLIDQIRVAKTQPTPVHTAPLVVESREVSQRPPAFVMASPLPLHSPASDYGTPTTSSAEGTFTFDTTGERDLELGSSPDVERPKKKGLLERLGRGLGLVNPAPQLVNMSLAQPGVHEV
ncbi:MAG: hypothetical protein S4CHLAM37_15780 [Chlamydiia bacterium]|nr:hypothetical protein [Chlamydiia bacterium]